MTEMLERAAAKEAPTYHDLHITTPSIARTSISDLPYRVRAHCTRVAGWAVWALAEDDLPEEHLGGEYARGGLRLDVAGHVIVDTLERPSNDDA